MGFCKCSRCGEEKRVRHFSPRPDRPGKYRTWCKECQSRYNKSWRLAHPRRNSDWYRKTTLGVTPEEFDSLLTKQEGKCALCSIKPARSLNLDHDHATGRIRSLLCSSCNVALGLLKDSPELLRAAATYVEAHRKDAVAI